jgi:hypothetical protein
MSEAPSIDYEALASEVIRALRGERSQLAFSRRLGRASNVVYAWESGRSFPTAAETLRAAALRGHDVRAILARFAADRAPTSSTSRSSTSERASRRSCAA